MTKFNLEIYEGHAIIQSEDNRMLINTGSPSTIHIADSLFFCNENYPALTNYDGLTIQKIADGLGITITTLLGTDILSEYRVLFDYRNKSMQFSKDEISLPGLKAPISLYNGLPVVEIKIASKVLTMFLDTGVRLSYLTNDFITGFSSLGCLDEDFHPFLGKFYTKIYEIRTSFDNQLFPVTYGILPPLLEDNLIANKTDGIIGFDFLSNFRVMLDLENKYLQYELPTDPGWQPQKQNR